MAVKYLAGDRIIGTAAERAALTTTTFPNTSWKEIGRFTVSGSATDTIEVKGLSSATSGTMTAKDNIMVLCHLPMATLANVYLTFNGDDAGSNANYGYRRSTNGNTTDSSDNSQDGINIGNALALDNLVVCDIRNGTREKFVIYHTNEQGATGSGTAPDREEAVGKWANTNQITTLQFKGATANCFSVGAEVVVLGCDDDEADSGTNFWQEIGTDELTSQGDVLTTGTIAAKKYLWIQTHHLGDITSGTSANSDFNMTFNDSTSGYATKSSQNGGADGIGTNTAFINGWIGYQDRFNNTFMINVASKEKLAYGQETGGITAYGAGTGSNTDEWVGKWANTSDSITKVTVTNSSARSGAYGVGSNLKVWGSN